MRTIKFRAWDNKSNMYVIASHVMNIHTGQISDLPERFSLEQFTGLHDKNGKEIYEGDIVRAEYSGFNEEGEKSGLWIGDIQYKKCGYHIMTHEDYNPFLTNLWINTIEVIGNIHEKPELIEDAHADR